MAQDLRGNVLVGGSYRAAERSETARPICGKAAVRICIPGLRVRLGFVAVLSHHYLYLPSGHEIHAAWRWDDFGRNRWKYCVPTNFDSTRTRWRHTDVQSSSEV